MRRVPDRTWLGVLIFAAFCLRMAYAGATTGLGQPLPVHYREYILAGHRLLEQGTLVSPLVTEESPTAPSALLPPAYAGLVAVVCGVLGTETFAATLVLQLINAVATSATVALVFFIARRIAGGAAAWAAALIAVVNPTLFGFTTYMWDTCAFCLGVALAVWISQRLSDKRAGWHLWLGFGLYLGALALLNPALTIAYPLLVLWPLTKLYGWRAGPMLAPVALSVVGWLFAIMPWTIRNYVHFGELMYIRSGLMHEIWLGVCPEADTDPPAVYTRRFPLVSAGAQQWITSVGESAYLRECADRAKAAIWDDPWRFVRLTAIRAADYWAGTIFSHTAPGGGGWPTTSGRAAVALFLLLETLCAVLCVLILSRANRDVLWLAAIMISFSLVYCLTHMEVRFRVPSEPVMAILAGAFLARTVRLFCARPFVSSGENV